MLRKIGILLVVAGIALFVVAFLEVTIGNIPSSCYGSECFHGPARWILALPAGIFAFVGGLLLYQFAGRGYGRTAGPKDFVQVDTGAFAPQARTVPAPPATSRGTWSRSWRNLYVLTGLGETGLALLFVVVAVKVPESRGGMILTAAILGLVGIIFLAIGFRAAAKDRLHVTGLDAEGTIVGLTQTGMWMNNNPYVKLDLVIRVPGHPAYEVKHGEIVPQVLLGRLTDGSVLHLKVDPNKPSHFVVEWERT